jgi:hypothetical protein
MALSAKTPMVLCFVLNENKVKRLKKNTLLI